MAIKGEVKNDRAVITETGLGPDHEFGPQMKSYEMSGSQLKKHLDGGMFSNLSKGDKDALNDFVRESEKDGKG